MKANNYFGPESFGYYRTPESKGSRPKRFKNYT